MYSLFIPKPSMALHLEATGYALHRLRRFLCWMISTHHHGQSSTNFSRIVPPVVLESVLKNEVCFSVSRLDTFPFWKFKEIILELWEYDFFSSTAKYISWILSHLPIAVYWCSWVKTREECKSCCNLFIKRWFISCGFSFSEMVLLIVKRTIRFFLESSVKHVTSSLLGKS